MELNKLDKVALLARSRESAAATDLHRRQQDLQSSSARLEQLMSFKGEYEARLASMARSGIDPRQLADYRRFLGNLNAAISNQTEEAGRCRDRVDASREAFVEQSLRRESVDELISRCRAEQLAEEARREQRASDELTLRSFPHE